MATVFDLSKTANVVTIDDARTRLDDLLAKVGRGEEWFIVNAGGQPIAKLAPASPEAPPVAKRWKAFGMLKGQVKSTPDFDEPLEDFKPYME